MLAWKNTPNKKALIVKGLRQVGKTTSVCKFWLNGAEFPIKMVQKFWDNGTSFTDERCAFFILLESAEKGHSESGKKGHFQSIDLGH